jgi:tRNA A-37 threonylcarbamoyl transferase component Bud32
MSVPLEEFVKQLEESGVLASDTIHDLVPAKNPPQDADELAATLVAKKKLTKYQAELIIQGKGRALVLGNYTILEEIGAGGMGQVFKAEHRRMHRIVAVKVLARSRTKDAASAARFEREVTVAAKLNHPNIVTAYDADHVRGFHLLVMEYVDGSDLWAMAKKHGPLPVGQAIDCILQAARGLEAAHAAGILHRDIKPSNLILDKSGKVKVVDLGLASLNDVEADDQEPLTQDGTVLGTADFISPEQALDSRAADARSDVYSLGCTLYFLLTGRVMYPFETRMQKMLAHREEPVPSLRPLRSEVPDELETVLRKMVAKRPEDRQQSMTAVIADLERLQKNAAAAIKRRQPAASPMLKRMWLRGSLVGGLILVAGAAIALWTINGRRDSATQTPGQASLLEGAQSPDAARSHDTTRQSKPEAADGGPVAAGIRPPSERLRNIEFEKWVEEVAGLMADEQVAAVSLKLRELNRGFDGQLEPQIENGRVTKLELQADDLHDVSPVQALRSLKGLFCYRTAGKKGDFSDLSPLCDLPLENLYCGLSAVSDLSPLRDMRLSFLNIGVTNVRDLGPLAGMRLRSLDVGATPVSNLAPLRGMPLEYLNCSATNVTDLSPLKGMPLKELRCDFLRERDAEILQSIPTLEKINGKPVAEFWADAEDA